MIPGTAAPDGAAPDGDAKMREDEEDDDDLRPPGGALLDILDASSRARAAGVSDAALSRGTAAADAERGPRTGPSSFPLPPPPPAALYVLALSESPASALRAMASRRLRSCTSNAGVGGGSPP